MDIMQLLLEGGTPEQQQAVLAEQIRARKALQEGLSRGQQEGGKYDILNFVAQNANNPDLAQSVNALAKSQAARYKPDTLGQSAVLVGDQVLDNPAYTAQKSEDRQARLLQAAAMHQQRLTAAQQTADARREAEAGRNERAAESRALRMTIAGMSQSNRGVAQETKLDAAAEKALAAKAKNMETATQRLSQQYTKEGIPEFANAMDIVNETLAKHKKGELPGFGRVEGYVPDAMASDAMQEVRSAMQGAANILLKSRSGAAVTDSEMSRFLREVAAGKGMDEKTLRAGWARVDRTFGAKAAGLAAGFSPDVHEQYVQQGGRDFRAAGASTAPKRVKFDAQGNEVQ